MVTRQTADVLPITTLVAAKNEAANLPRCLAGLARASRIVVLDSRSTDATADVARAAGAEVCQFAYHGGYPKKRQWALSHLDIATSWVLLVDADEVFTPRLWDEIAASIRKPDAPDAFLVRKGFHFLGRRFRFGGFSFDAVALFRTGKARFERLLEDEATGLDMEVHERVIVEGRIGRLHAPLIHEDAKGLEAYLARHNRYSTWEAKVRDAFFRTGNWGLEGIRPTLFGNTQERRRFMKLLAVRAPGEPWMWFLYHYMIRLGCLEGRPGLIASQIRANYVREIRAKLYELRSARQRQP